MADERRNEVALAVSEAVTNAFSAQQEAGCEQAVTIGVTLKGDSLLEVIVTDAGIGFEPWSNGGGPGAAHDGAREGGYGLTVMRGIADHLHFSLDGGTTVRMGFSLR